jgi:probable F420-dependent oxidoreductase
LLDQSRGDRRVQFIYQYPDTHGTESDLLDAGPVVEVARAVEAAGWSGISFTEHPVPGARWLELGGHQTLDPFIALSHAAAVTDRIRLLTYLAVLPYRNPFLTAKAAASVDKLSNGRMILGVGTGYQKSEFHALGVEFSDRNTLFDEALDAMPLHWRGDPFSFAGSGYEARDVIARPRPVQQPIPIWIGGNAKVTMQRVAEKAQGWMPLTGPADMSSSVRTPHIDDGEDLARRIAQVKDLAGARAAALDFVVAYQALDPLVPATDAARHREAFASLEAAGVTWIVVPGATDNPSATLGFIEAFGTTYLAS